MLPLSTPGSPSHIRVEDQPLKQKECEKRPNAVSRRVFGESHNQQRARRALFETSKDSNIKGRPFPTPYSDRELAEDFLTQSAPSGRKIPAPVEQASKGEEVTINASSFFEDTQEISFDLSLISGNGSPKRKCKFPPKHSSLEKKSRDKPKAVLMPMILGEEIFLLNSRTLHVKFLTQGNEHKIFGFTDEFETLSLESGEISFTNIILRTPRPDLGNSKIKELQLNAIEAFNNLNALGVPLPVCYLNPANFVDEINPRNGGFWLLEKMAEKVTVDGWKNDKPFEELDAKDQDVLEFVHSWLKRSFEAKCDLIPDFFPRNVMRDAKGQLKVVDFGITKNVWINNLNNYVIAWSAGNPNIKEYLESALR